MATRRPGPKPRLPTLQPHLLELANKGYPNRTIAQLCRISESTLYAWIRNNPDFAEAYAEAKAGGITKHVDHIATNEDWRARAWLLERMDPTNWGKAEIDLTGLEQKLAAYLRGHQDATKDANHDHTNT